jgi:O-antigen/teichoic acid export membrane protein
VKTLFSRVASFASLSIVGSLVPLAVLPIVARVGGPSDWVVIASGQAMGGIIAIFVMLGWELAGPVKLLQTSNKSEALTVYSESFWARTLTLGFIALPVTAILVSTPMGSSNKLLAVLSVASLAITGLSMLWFSIGTGSPKSAMNYEVLPRVVSILLSVPLLLFTSNVFWYPLFQTLGFLFGLLLFHRHVFGRIFPPRISVRHSIRTIFRNKEISVTTAIGSSFSLIPVVLVAATFPVAAAAAFVSADKIFRYSLFSITSLNNGLQHWSATAPNPAVASTRRSIAVLFHLVLGLVGSTLIWLAGSQVTAVLFGPKTQATHETLLFFGLNFLFLSVLTPTIRLYALPRGMSKTVMWSTMVGVAIGAICLVVLPGLIGISGVAASLTIEIAATLVLISLFLVRRRKKSAEQGIELGKPG